MVHITHTGEYIILQTMEMRVALKKSNIREISLEGTKILFLFMNRETSELLFTDKKSANNCFKRIIKQHVP